MNRKLSAILLGVSALACLPWLAKAAYYQAIDQQYNDSNPWGTTQPATKPYKAPENDVQDAASTKIDPWSNRSVKREMSDQQITEVLVKGSIANYTGDCPCPYSTGKDGKKCGDSSEYIMVPGELLCYPEDVTQKEIFEFRAKNRIPNPNQPWMIYR